ncbi:uncharacterized protein V1516DRAFT_671440 [Lipomyces oligophaga]|uniref:uncharacterized protein n=1 Tax=Lipomyces oligophaga TaxID=45792 RepID=UPI0034CDD617
MAPSSYSPSQYYSILHSSDPSSSDPAPPPLPPHIPVNGASSATAYGVSQQHSQPSWNQFVPSPAVNSDTYAQSSNYSTLSNRGAASGAGSSTNPGQAPPSYAAAVPAYQSSNQSSQQQHTADRNTTSLGAGSATLDPALFIPETLKSVTQQELASLITDDAVLSAYFTAQHPVSKSHLSTIQSLVSAIDTVGQRIASAEPALAESRTRAAAALREAQHLDTEWHVKEREMYESLQPFSAPRLRSRLVNATAEAEHVSEALATSFLDQSNIGGQRDADAAAQFVREYRQVRRIFHLRKERLERWNEERVGGIAHTDLIPE